MKHVVELREVTKKIEKDTVLSSIDVHFESGKIYGIVGKNGSGKTMMFRVMSGLVKPTYGKILIDGKELYKEQSLVENLGLIIENEEMDPTLTAFQNLQLLAGINKKIGVDEIKHAMELVGLDPMDKRKYKKYSLGMRQKAAIAQAIMEDPDYIFLDEPTNGLDDDTVSDFCEMLLKEKAKGKLIVIASHSKEVIERICDEYYEMKQGHLERKN